MNATDKKIKPLWVVEKETIEQAIEMCDGNIPKAAAYLEISPSTIYRKKAHWPELDHVLGHATEVMESGTPETTKE